MNIKKTFNDNMLYKLFFEKSIVAHLIYRKGTIIACNQMARDIFGYKVKEELLSKEIENLFYDEWEKILNKLNRNFKNKIRTTCIKKNGYKFPVEVGISSFDFYGDKVMTISICDIADRIKVEDELEESNKIFNDVFNENAFSIIIIDPENIDIVDANRAACNFYGYSKDEISRLKLNLKDICISSGRDILNEISKIKLNPKNRHFASHKLASGEIREVELYSGLINFSNRKLIYSIVYDVTDKVRALRELKESEERFKTLFHNAKDAMVLHKIDSEGRPGKFMEVNDATCRKYGYTRKELLNMDPHNLDVKEKHHLIKVHGKEIIKNRHMTFETVNVTKEDKKIFVENSSHIFNLFGEEVVLTISRDITARKKMEESLRQSEKRYRLLVDILPDIILVLVDDRIELANAAAVNYLGGNDLDELIGKKVGEFLQTHPDYREICNKMKEEIEAKGITNFREIKAIRKIDGKVLDLETTFKYFNYEGCRAKLLVGRDITDRKNAERYKRLFDEVVQYDKLKTQFFSNISHELRTPLNLILSTVQLLEINKIEEKYKCMDLDSYQRRIRILRQNCYRLLRLINNIIDITKIDSGCYELDLRKHDIVRIVENITIAVAEYIKKMGIKLTFDTNVEEKIMVCDGKKIERIILNLLSNSIKFTKPEGFIRVTLGCRNNNIYIAIEDTGIGIPEEQIDYIFHLFRQVDKSFTRTHEGSGIGLSIVRELVAMHNGTIKVKSELGKGTKFVIEIPVIDFPIDLNKNVEPLDDEIKRRHTEIINIEFSDIYIG